MEKDQRYLELAELAYLVLEGKVSVKEFLSRQKEFENELK
jgi:hypothetical protein